MQVACIHTFTHRCNWLEDPSASARILPPLNLCFDLDDTLIFNAPVKNTKVPLEYVVHEPPHVLVEDVDPNAEITSSDSPFVRPHVCFLTPPLQCLPT